jgi:hypothetical protein
MPNEEEDFWAHPLIEQKQSFVQFGGERETSPLL